MIHMSEKPTYEELLKRVLELEKAELENKRNSESNTLQPAGQMSFPGKMPPLPPENIESLSFEEIRQVLHDLHVHQVELEMQNEELRTMQADLDAARTRYFDLYDLAPVGYCTLSKKGMILETNLTAATLIGVPRSSLIKQPLARYILPDDQHIYYLHRKQLFETGEPLTCDLRMLKKDGTQFWAHLVATCAQDIDSAPVCRVVITDITERWRAEEALQRSEALYRLVVENINDIIWTFDLSSMAYTFVSPSVQRILGYADETMVKNLDVIFTPETKRHVLKAFENFMKGYTEGAILVLGAEHRKKDGSLIWMEINTSPLKDNIGNIVGFLGSTRDITERKRAEETLQETEKQFRVIFEKSPYAMALTEINSGHLVEVNDVMCEKVGIGKEYLIGKTTTELNFYSPENRAIFTKMLLKNAKVDGLEMHFQTKNQVYLTKMYAELLTINNSEYIFTTFEDITERKRAEEKIQRNESRLRRLLDILQHPSQTIQDFLDYALDQAIQLTESQIGYIYHYDENSKKFVLNTWSKEVMTECTVANPSNCYALDMTGIWGEAVRQRRSIIVNDFQAANPLKKGYPEGHVQLVKFMTVPIFKDNCIVGVVGVANKETDYEESDILQVSLLMEAVWKVTERKQAEEALRESEAKYRLLFEKMLNAFALHEIVLDAQGKPADYVFLEANSAFEQLTGLNNKSIIGKKATEVLPGIEQCPEDWVGLYGKVALTNQERRFEQYSRHMGKWFSVLAFSPQKGRFATIFSDITRRKEAEEAIRKISAAVEQSPVTIVITDTTGTIEYVNPKFTETTGYTFAEAIGQNPHILKSRELPLEAYNVLWNTIVTGDTWRGEFHNKKKNGEFYWEQASISPVRDSEGTITNFIAIKEDITERKQSEEMLRESEDRLRQALDAAHIGDWELDLKTKISRRSSRYIEILGLTAPLSDWNIQVFLKHVHPDDRSRVELSMQKTLAVNQDWHDEFRIIRDDRKVRWIWAKTHIFKDPQGQPSKMHGMISDITEQKRVEEELLHINMTLEQRVAREVEKNMEQERILVRQSRLAAMGEMIGNIAHQWRQPLNALGLLIFNIKDAYQFNKLDAAYLDQAVADGRRMVQKMSTTISDFSNFFRPNKEVIVFSALEQIREASALVESSFQQSNISIHIDASQDIKLLGFPNEYSQVLLNLLTNAKDAILLHNQKLSGKVDIVITEQDGQGCVSVCDNGGGIPADILDRIFDPYFSTKGKGSGIGLYMSKMIIERNMNGSITALNIEGGAEFSVCTPLTKEVLYYPP